MRQSGIGRTEGPIPSMEVNNKKSVVNCGKKRLSWDGWGLFLDPVMKFGGRGGLHRRAKRRLCVFIVWRKVPGIRGDLSGELMVMGCYAGFG